MLSMDHLRTVNTKSFLLKTWSMLPKIRLWSKTITNRPRMSLPNSKELKPKLLRWLTNYPRTTRKVLQSKRRKSLRQANHNQSKICQELQKRTPNLRRGRSSRRSSSLREPSGTPKGSGRSLTQREMLSSFKRLSKPTVTTISKTVIQRVIETSENRPVIAY